MADPLHLVRVPLTPSRLAGVARVKHVPVSELDEGYLAHCAMRELWQDAAPSPFLLRGRGAVLEAWGYGRSAAAQLVQHAQSRPAGEAVRLVDVPGVQSKPVLRFDVGRRVGFHLRACPVVRLASPTHGHKAGAEVDAFLARCFSVRDDEPVSRESVYLEWARRQLREDVVGARLESVRVAAMARERLVRRTHGDLRHARRIERPDVRFEGVIVVTVPDRFLECLARGVGRHKAFGFGALMLVPPGRAWDR